MAEHGMSKCVTVTTRNIEELGFPETLEGQADAVFLDLPGPWKVVPSAARCLKPDGRCAAMTWLFNFCCVLIRLPIFEYPNTVKLVGNAECCIRLIQNVCPRQSPPGCVSCACHAVSSLILCLVISRPDHLSSGNQASSFPLVNADTHVKGKMQGQTSCIYN